MPTLTQASLQTRLRAARRAAQAAGDIMMAYYGQVLQIQTKSSDVDLVTHVDLEADERIREILTEEFPDERIITEETYKDGDPFQLDHAWLVDPVDGTTNYAHAFPHFAVSIAYVEHGQPKVAVIFDPFKNELFTAVADGPAMRNGVEIRVTVTDVLAKALLATGFPYNRQVEDPRQTNIELHSHFLQRTHGIRRAGAAALDLAYVACSRLDGFWEMRLSPWDVAAGILLIERAGGVVSGFAGEPIDLTRRHIDILGANPALHPKLVDVTRGY